MPAKALLSAATAAVLLLTATPAGAASIDQELRQARTAQERKVAHLHRIEVKLADLLANYAKLEKVAGRSVLRLVAARREEQAAADRLAEAELRLAERARTAYEMGPGVTIEAFLTAGTLADLVAVHEFTARTLAEDVRLVQELDALRAELGERRTDAERARAATLPKERRLARLLERMRARVAEAERVARQAGLEVESLEQKRRVLMRASARQVGRNLVVAGVADADRDEMLALLGPNQGQGCEIPETLIDTGRSFSGDASWYGWDFAGQSTANGNIFDPRLFTAANRWLPFGTFLRVRYAGKCAIVLVNDRGPYGNYERVIDLSMAAAKYLGVGVSPVTADILVPA